MHQALFLNGVFEDVLEEVVEAQQKNQHLVCYLQPYKSEKILLLAKQQPTRESPIKLYVSTTTNLGNVCYIADIVGWEHKQELAPGRLDFLNKHIKKHQPGETCVYMTKDNGKPCVNLISLTNLKRLPNPFSVNNLIKTSDETPVKTRTRAGGWSYVYLLPGWIGTENTVVKEILDAELEKEIKKSRESDPEARRQRLENAPEIPKQIQVVSRAYRRNADVIQEALERAAGICDHCKKKAPFLRASDGTPYLEVHHWVPLSEKGLDNVENAGALCPNCHRELHFGQEG